MKRYLRLIVVSLLAVFCLSNKNVFAETYYTNKNGVEFTKEKYDFFTRAVREGYQEIVTQEMVDELDGLDLENLTVRKNKACMNDNSSKITNPTRDSTYYVNLYISFEMTNYCLTDTICRIISDVEWQGVPAVESLDVIGAYIDGPTRIGTPTTIAMTTQNSANMAATVYDTDGFGVIFQVPSGNNLIISQNFLYTGHGDVFVSYQHAFETIPVLTAQQFTIGLSGYGNVFQFYGDAIYAYDDWTGLYMYV